jgi:phenylalanyl-tRNA synthetase beta chain
VLISLNWIKEFVNLPDRSADDLANDFTMTTAEVEEVTTTYKHLEVIKVAQIKSLKKHPEADKLNLVTIDFGGESKEVVCGAGNVKEGLKIPYAPLGVTLPNGLTLEPKKIRGVLSEGMLCSADELGHGEKTDGLLELEDSAQIGTSMIEYFNLEADTIIDVDNKSLTHRPDLWGHYGLAREFSARYETELKNPFDADWKSELEKNFNDTKSPITPKVDSDSSCKAYYGLSVDGVSVTDSPEWLKSKLEACGLRSINNIVDVSNYVMMELGMPLHIFDRDLVKDNTIHIKRAGSELNFTTLDEVERKLIESDTVICDSEKPLVLAGIMGGQNSGVSESTKNIFIEVANWTAEEVRSTSTRLGLRSDSSARYEKSLDSLQCYRTLLRTYELVKKICPEVKVIGKPEYDGDDLSLIKPLVIKTSTQRISKILGHKLSTEKLSSIFTHLDFGIKESNGDFELTMPSYRTTKDIEFEADIVEEVGRVIGYDNITPVSPTTDIKSTRFEPAKILHRKIQDYMTLNARALEVMTYPMIGEKLLNKANWASMNEELVLVNALSKDADRMRPSLVPHALNTVAINAKQFSSFSFFEIGRAYLPDDKNFSTERNQILIGMYDKKETPFLKLLNTVEGLLNYLNISFDFSSDSGKFTNEIIPKDWDGSHPHEYLNLRIQGKFHGACTTVHPLTLRAFKTKGFFSMAVIDIADLENREQKDKTKYAPISKFPGSKFDCTVVTNKDTPAALVIESLKRIKLKEIDTKKITDVFSLNDEQNAITVSVTFEDPNKTLDNDFIKAAEEKIISTLEAAGFSLKA